MSLIEDITINGDDSQNVIGNTVDGNLIITQIRNVRRRPSMFLSEGEITDRVAAYVPALNHELIAQVLAQNNIVTLSAPEGAGVTTTAIAALRQVRPGLPIQRFFSGEDDVDEVATQTKANGYLVRARDEDPSRLRRFLEAVRASSGFAAIVGTTAELRRFADYLQAIDVRPPSARAVYRSHLAHRGLGESGWPYWPRGLELLKEASPSDARRLVLLIDELRAAGGDEVDVERAYLGWGDDLHKWFSVHRDLLDQTLMIAAAAIAPADETQIYGAALSLARRLEISPPGGGLAWTPTTHLADLLETSRDDDSIVFNRHGYEKSVLRHICMEYPLARMELLSWLSDIPTDRVLALSPLLGHRLVGVFTELAAEYNKPDKVTQQAKTWSEDGRPDLAYIALSESCLHPIVGRAVRRMLYEWSRWRQAPQTLKLTVIRVCQVLGQTHLPMALTRLRHLATFGNEQVREEVLQVARALAEIDSETVFRTALRWTETASDDSVRDTIRRLDVAMRVLLDLLPHYGNAELRCILEILDRLVTNGHPRLRPHLLAWAKELAVEHRGQVLNLAVALAASADAGTATANARRVFGTELFLSLVTSRDDAGLPAILTSLPSIDAGRSSSPWRVALSVPGEFPLFHQALHLWLNTATVREDLRPTLVFALVAAAHPDLLRRQRLTAVVQAWAAADARTRRTVKEAILTRILLPERHRWLLILWVRLRTALLPGL